MIYNKFSGYVAGRRLYFDGGGGDGGGDGGLGFSGDEGTGPAGGLGPAGDGIGDAGVSAGVPDAYNPWTDSAAYMMPPGIFANPAQPAPAYNSQPPAQPQGNANIYQPAYTDYGPGQANAISNYGQGIANPFGAFVNPFPQGSSQGIASLYNHPEYADYGISGLNR